MRSAPCKSCTGTSSAAAPYRHSLLSTPAGQCQPASAPLPAYTWQQWPATAAGGGSHQAPAERGAQGAQAQGRRRGRGSAGGRAGGRRPRRRPRRAAGQAPALGSAGRVQPGQAAPDAHGRAGQPDGRVRRVGAGARAVPGPGARPRRPPYGLRRPPGRGGRAQPAPAPAHAAPKQPAARPQVEEVVYPVPEDEAAKYMLHRDGCAGQLAFLVYDSVRAPGWPRLGTSAETMLRHPGRRVWLRRR